jgi:hypothetical protein
MRAITLLECAGAGSSARGIRHHLMSSPVRSRTREALKSPDALCDVSVSNADLLAHHCRLVSQQNVELSNILVRH